MAAPLWRPHRSAASTIQLTGRRSGEDSYEAIDGRRSRACRLASPTLTNERAATPGARVLRRVTKGHTAQQTSPTWSARPMGLAQKSRWITGQITRVGRGDGVAVVGLVGPRGAGRDLRRSATRFSHRRSRVTALGRGAAGARPDTRISASRAAVSSARVSKRTKTVPVRGFARALWTAGCACSVITRRRSSASERSGRCTRRRPGSAWRTVRLARAGFVIVHLSISVAPGTPGRWGRVAFAGCARRRCR